jgi:hypothetical protein
MNSPKGFKPMCLSVAHPGRADGEDSMYVLDRCPGKSAARCFEVLEPMPIFGCFMPPWRWRFLPPPPFVRQPGYEPSSTTSFTTMVHRNGCSTIYVSCDHGIGTYSLEMAHFSEIWSHLGEWKMPFHGRAQYVPEFKLSLHHGIDIGALVLVNIIYPFFSG